MAYLFRQIHRIYYLVIVFFLAVLFYPFIYLAASRERWYVHLNWLRVLQSRLSSSLSGVHYRFDFDEPLDPDQTYIFCANHSSNLDILIMCILAKRRFHFMGKEDLLDHPILKIYFRTIDVSVNRESRISAFRAFKKAGSNLDSGMSLIIFPEGGINDLNYPPRLQPFKNGPFRLAIDHNVPIVPVAITNAWKLLWNDGIKYGSRPGTCVIHVHKPIFTSNLTAVDAEMLKEDVFLKIESKLLHI
jgi:1-acyl-sn-glycerol-3-phosphate acyltransferase